MSSMTSDDDDWREHQSSWFGVVVAFITVAVTVAAVTLL